MIAIDTNVLIYSHRQDSPFYDVALGQLQQLVDRGDPWAIPWPCIHEFYNATTNARRMTVAAPPLRALDQVDAWVEAGAVLLAEGPDHLRVLRQLVDTGHIVGPRVHDARIAAICLSHGISELWTADRDFSRFPALKTRNPLVRPGT